MCGIAGWIDYTQDISGRGDIMEPMAQTLRNRGPDEGGRYGTRHAQLVHRRLAVVDLEHGKQPMGLTWEGTCYRMVYNGELYNTEELRRQLNSLGHSFTGHSDTEVLLHAYTQWGVDCLERLNGIYAFAVWNEEEQSLFLARDRMGVKPLFFYCLEGGVVFGSQLKTLLAHPGVEPVVDKDGLRELFFLGPGRTPGCGVFRGVEELKPAQYAVLDRQNGLRVRTYWRLEARPHEDGRERTVERTRELVLEAIRGQLVSDVPLCCLLSGGLDSSIISHVAAERYRAEGRQLTTLSVDYADNDRYFKESVFQPGSDGVYIEMMRRAIGSRHRYIELQNSDLAQALAPAALARDLPGMADIDSSLLLFCREIKKEFTVAVSGECADELFGGYPWFHNPEVLYRESFPWAQSMAARSQVLRAGVLGDGEAYVRQRYLDTVGQADTLPGESALNRRMREMTVLNLQWFMQTLLDRKDRMSMECGLEVRVPFCDHRIVEYTYNMPWELKALDGREKGVLRYAVEDLLPREVVWRKKSPYPKTHNPIFWELVVAGVRRVRADSASPLQELVDWEGVEAVIQNPGSLPSPWYGQLMGAPQVLAYLIQMDAWFREFGVKLV